VSTVDGFLVSAPVAEAHGIPFTPLVELLV
jgi:hypothetical protein